MREVLGWTSSLVLLVTILAQIHKQWTERTGRGVSTFLFVGQTAASLGFTVYSVLVHNWVFTVTNGLMLLSAIVGWYITVRFKNQAQERPDPSPNASPVEGRLSPISGPSRETPHAL
jgi:MtN3 and saliva related transmembrane protein